MKITLISSTGGHWTQLSELISEIKKTTGDKDLTIITEKNKVTEARKDITFLLQQDRKNKLFILIFMWNILLSIKYVFTHKPDFVISTGAGVVLPYLLFAKIAGSKIIYIESFAKTTTPTITGRIVYRFADEFFVQWPSMLGVYPKAKYRGSLY